MALNPPLGTTDPQVFMGNVQRQDRLINGQDETVPDRGGVPRKSWSAIEKGFDAIVSSLDSAGVKTFPDVDSGLSATVSGEYFRKINGSGNDVAFTYYKNINGNAIQITSILSDKYYYSIKNTVDQSQSTISIFLDKFFTEHFSTSGIGSVNLTDFTLMKIVNVINPATAMTGLVCNLHISLDESEVYALKLLPGESVTSAGRASPYVRHTIRDRQLSAVAIDTETGFVRFKALWESPDFIYNSINNYNIYDITGTFSSVTQIQAGSVTSRSVSSFTGEVNPGFQIAIPASEITDAGFDATNIGSITSYVDQIYGELDFWCLSATTFFIPEMTKMLLSSGAVEISGDNNISVSIDFYKAPEEDSRVVISGSGMVKYSATIQNNLDHDLHDAVSHIRAAFPPGEVSSAGNLLLLDASGERLPCQWLPDPEVNFSSERMMGYYSDGSLRSGSVVFNHSIPEKSESSIVINIASNTVKPSTPPELVKEVDGYSLQTGGYLFLFGSDNGYQLSSFTKNGITRKLTYSAYLADQLYTVAGYDKPMRAGFKSISVTAWGDVFTEVTTVLEYKSVRATVKTRLFVSGRVTVDTTFITMEDIPADIIYGLTGRMESYSPKSQRSSSLMCIYWSDNGTNRSSQLTYCHGHIHRDGDQYEARLPVWSFTALPTNENVRLYGGWMYRSATYPISAIAKDTAFAHGFVVELEQKQSDLQSANDATHNLPTGYAGKGTIQASARRQLLRDLLDYVEARSEYWDGYFDEHNVTRDQNTYATHLALLKYGSSRKFSFGQIYSNFKGYIDSKFGGAENLGMAYKNNILILQFASRAVLPNILWLYKEAVLAGDVGKQEEMKAAAASLAEAMMTTFNEKGFVPLIYTDTAGNSNSNATALRALAIAVHFEMDGDGRYAETINRIEDVLKSNYMLNKNILTESFNGQLSTNQYLHYSMYAYHDYLSACSMLNRPLAVDMTTYVLTSLSAYGALREQEFCISNSRKGSSLTYAYHISVLNKLGGLSGQNACRALLSHMLEQMNPDNTMPRPMDNWPENLNTGAASPVPFELQALSEVLLEEFYS